MKLNKKFIKKINFLYLSLIFVFILIICILCYGYNRGLCKMNKKYICDNNFCLYKEFNVYLKDVIKNEISYLLTNKEIQKRVDIEPFPKIFPETIFNCALPNKKGVTISTTNIIKYAPNLINYYENELCKLVTNQLNIKLFPTDLILPTSCALLIYEKEGDWVNWHYDHNYYNGRFFTVLIPITNNLTCTEFQLKNDKNEIKSIKLSNNNSICFEGNYLYHRASKLCKNEKRVVLSCQYVTNNEMSFLNKFQIKLKDFAYTGKIEF
uniref:Fe2OG dioxygenase domain-containing protein n=1 Tax=viral metagenome TaxID=1070528 RepID=A0A6C0BSE2_9ZZZZ